jgi:hypothetical protein
MNTSKYKGCKKRLKNLFGRSKRSTVREGNCPVMGKRFAIHQHSEGGEVEKEAERTHIYVLSFALLS